MIERDCMAAERLRRRGRCPKDIAHIRYNYRKNLWYVATRAAIDLGPPTLSALISKMSK
jgi:hypothetical protein